MAVRHRTACVEAVQYHPESCMSEGGKGLVANFLKMKGGTWGGENAWCGVPGPSASTSRSEASASARANGVSLATESAGAMADGQNVGSGNGPEVVQKGDIDSTDNAQPDGLVNGVAAISGAGLANGNGTSAKESTTPAASGSNANAGLPTILNRIHTQRLSDVKASSTIPSTTPANIQKSIDLHTCPPLISFVDRIKSTPHTAIMAEIKRASPSKGDIAPLASAPEQGIKYAMAGASVISVLTEPKWFKGGLVDMLAVRNAVSSIPNRPAILRKDFIVSTYQIDEARLYGADTVLLIVAMLDITLLKELYTYSVSIGMEPLVEVNNPAELNIALDLGSKVIGVNNRNLHDFQVDMTTTSRVNAALEGRDVILCALSGISKPEDVEGYVKEGVKAVLVGESLMRAENTSEFLRALVGLPPITVGKEEGKPLVKICGIRSVDDAKMAITAGADMLGIVLVPGVKRSITKELASEIAAVVQSSRKSTQSQTTPKTKDQSSWFTHHAARLASKRKPLLVGVFRNQPLSDILDLVDSIPLDVVQLHGTEPQEYAQWIPVPVIKTFSVSQEGTISGGQITRPGLNAHILLDAAGAGGGGGEGKSFPWHYAKEVIERGEIGGGRLPVILAGGLHDGNVQQAVEQAGGVVGVDVSSGVEGADGWKDQGKVERFIKAVKG
jgi:anthranilate synthase/indole-3-glycerol phosphate synthase/phosphoribosylanthranilate isomerase